MVQETNISKRLELDSTAGDISVDMFVQKIMDQCNLVLRQHENLDITDYHAHAKYRTLEMEMVDVKVGNGF
jgi:hypothetical protein